MIYSENKGGYKMGKDVWNTWHDKSFDCNKYLYHYTSVEKARKILYNGTLRFSPIIYTNDTVEAKVKIQFTGHDIKDYDKKRKKINEYMLKYNKYLQLLCFCKDKKRGNGRNTICTKENEMYYVDMTGRGFSLPRMWAQYADNNKGVCLIVNKAKFEKKFPNNLRLILEESVQYKDYFTPFSMSGEVLEGLYEAICDDGDTTMTGLLFADKHLEYIRYSFFTKFLDWKNENEYRYLIASDNTKFKEIKNLSKYIEGIVVGEKMEDIDKWTIVQLAKRNYCEVKQIEFAYNCCRLENIEMEEKEDVYK